eukprot:1112600-Pyramimonas_sp.AAC.1
MRGPDTLEEGLLRCGHDSLQHSPSMLRQLIGRAPSPSSSRAHGIGAGPPGDPSDVLEAGRRKVSAAQWQARL